MQLEDQIVLWFHGVNNTKWDMSSYSQIADINNIVEFSTILKSIDHKMFPNSMFFLMKQGVEPTWECPENNTRHFQRLLYLNDWWLLSVLQFLAYAPT